MALIDISYFVRDIHVAQKSQPEVAENLTDYIKVYEQKFLKLLLGETLFNEFESALKTGEPLEPRWEALKTELLMKFVNNAETPLYGGKASPIANFVYVALLEDEILINTGIGVVLTVGENSVKANPLDKIVRAWNSMLGMLGPIHALLTNGDYPSYKFAHLRDLVGGSCGCGCGCNKAVFKYRNTLGL